MSEINFLKDYFNSLKNLLNHERYIDDLILVKDVLKKVHSEGKKTMIFGNGGSAAIASHFSVDLTKNAKVRATNYNESDLITCFANDYGFEHWAEKAVDFYGDEGDLLIVISSSGQSNNMLNAVRAARKANFDSVITLSGFSEDNPLNKLGDINLWVNNKSYNFVENVHQIWLLAITDLIIGKREYLA